MAIFSLSWGTSSKSAQPVYRAWTINQDSFQIKIYRQRLIMEIFGGSHLKAQHLWYNIKQSKCFYFQKHVGRVCNSCSFAKTFAHQLIQTKQKISLMRRNFDQEEKANSQNDRQMCSGHEDVPIVMHNQDQLKSNLMDLWLKEMWPPSSTDCNP